MVHYNFVHASWCTKRCHAKFMWVFVSFPFQVYAQPTEISMIKLF